MLVRPPLLVDVLPVDTKVGAIDCDFALLATVATEPIGPFDLEQQAEKE